MVTGPFSTQNLPTKIHTNWGKKFYRVEYKSTKAQKIHNSPVLFCVF
jgi:hypothetical protein